MEKISNFKDIGIFDSFKDLKILLKSKDYFEITRKVENFTRSLLEQENRKYVTIEILNNLCEVLEALVKELNDNVEVTRLIAEVLRTLRNSCVGEPGNQRMIAVDTTAIDSTCEVVKLKLHSCEDDDIVCLRIGTQFIGNLVVNNRETQSIIWNKCSPILVELMKHRDKKVANYSCMVVYNVLLGNSDVIPVLLEDPTQLLEVLFEDAITDCEFALFAIELLLSRPGCLPTVYNKVNLKHRLFLLDCLHSMIIVKSESSIPMSSITFLADEFKTHSDCILKTCDTYVETLEPAEVSKLLQFLASSCAQSIYQSQLQMDKSLLINCAMLLRSMHSLGKSGDNYFSAMQKMSDLSLTVRHKDIEQHPAFGFKSCLIQMLANLCWRHLDNQNEIRELDCIPVLMDCCNIDARNPLIIQWVVLAVHNLCENNRENQAVVAGMTTQGVVDSSMLHEMGLTIHADEDNKIVIVPLEKKPA